MEILDSHSDCYHNDPNQAMNDYKSERAMRKQSEIDRRPPIRTYFGYVLANSNRKVSKSAKIHTQDISKKCMKDTQPSHRSHPTKTVDIHNQKAAPDDIQYVRVGDWISIHVNRQEYDGQICPDGPIRTRRRYVGTNNINQMHGRKKTTTKSWNGTTTLDDRDILLMNLDSKIATEKMNKEDSF